MNRQVLGILAFACACVSCPAVAGEEDALFASALAALGEERPNDAIAAFESMADRGIVDAAASFNRGLAYAQRVRSGAGKPGDLGQAAHGFEEAKELVPEGQVSDGAARALAIVRGEVARRKAQSGESVDVDRGDPLGRAVVRVLPEDHWALGALVAAFALGVSLFVRDASRAKRVRLGASVVAALGAPLLVAFSILTWAARHDRLTVREAVVIAPVARLADGRGIALGGGGTLPEGARVRVLESNGTLSRIAWGAVDAWVHASSLRPLALRR